MKNNKQQTSFLIESDLSKYIDYLLYQKKFKSMAACLNSLIKEKMKADMEYKYFLKREREK
jgi:hypothetical protein